jgi:hypothetical protein
LAWHALQHPSIVHKHPPLKSQPSVPFIAKGNSSYKSVIACAIKSTDGNDLGHSVLCVDYVLERFPASEEFLEINVFALAQYMALADVILVAEPGGRLQSSQLIPK